MHRLSKTADYTFTLSKPDRAEIFRLLKPIGSLESRSDFIKDIDSLFVYDKTYGLSRMPTDNEQSKIFTAILKHSDALLGVLKTIRRGDDDICVDVHTATLIHMSRSILVQEKLRSLNELPKLNLLKIADSGIVDFTYPTQLILSLEEMRDAVILAANRVKSNAWNSPNRNNKTFRKKHLANVFVANYLFRFNKLPPITEKGAANQIFNILLSATGLQGNFELHSLREAVERHKGMPTKKKVRKSTENTKGNT